MPQRAWPLQALTDFVSSGMSTSFTPATRRVAASHSRYDAVPEGWMSPHDGRRVIATLTKEGMKEGTKQVMKQVDVAPLAHAANESAVLDGISPADLTKVGRAPPRAQPPPNRRHSRR